MFMPFFSALLFVNFILLTNSLPYGGHDLAYDLPPSNSLYGNAYNDKLNPLYSTYNTINHPSTYNYGSAGVLPYDNGYNSNYGASHYHGGNAGYNNGLQNYAPQPYICCGISYNNNLQPYGNNALPYTAGNTLPYSGNALPYSPYPLTGNNYPVSGYDNGYSSGSLYPIDGALPYGQNPTALPYDSTPYTPASYFCIPVCPNSYNNNGFSPAYNNNNNYLSPYNSPSYLNGGIYPHGSSLYSNGPYAQGLTTDFPLRKSSALSKSARPPVLPSLDAPSQQEKKSTNLLSIPTLKSRMTEKKKSV